MAYTILGQQRTVVTNGSFGNSNASSSFGLPGQDLPAAFCYCNFGVRIVIFDNLRCYMSVDGGSISQSNIYGDTFPCFIAARPTSFTPSPTNRTGEIYSATVNHNQNPGTFTWTMPSRGTAAAPPASVTTVAQLNSYMTGLGYEYIGLLTDFSWVEGSNDGYVWVGGTATYTVTNPIYPPAQRITMPAIKQYLDYFPEAIRKNSTWMSANRGGSAGRWIRKNGSWRQVKNQESGGTNQEWIRKNGSWQRAAKIGSGG